MSNLIKIQKFAFLIWVIVRIKRAKIDRSNKKYELYFKCNTPKTNTNTNEPVIPRATAIVQSNNNNTTQRNAFVTKPPAKREKEVYRLSYYSTTTKNEWTNVQPAKKYAIHTDYHFVHVNKSKYRNQVSTLEQYDAVLNLFNELGVKYHTYTPAERKNIYVLLKSIPTYYEEEDILQYLKDTGAMNTLNLIAHTMLYVTNVSPPMQLVNAHWTQILR